MPKQRGISQHAWKCNNSKCDCDEWMWPKKTHCIGCNCPKPKHPKYFSQTPDGKAICFEFNKGQPCKSANCTTTKVHCCQFEGCYSTTHGINICEAAIAAKCGYRFTYGS